MRDGLLVPPALRAIEYGIFQRIGQILLLHPAAVVVRVLVRFALRFGFAAAVRRILQMRRHRIVAHFARGALGGVHREDHGIGFFRLAHIDDRVAERDQPFGRAEMLEGDERGGRHDQRVRVRHTDVLTRVDDEAAQDEERVAAALDQAEGVIERGVGVAPPQALAEGGEEIVIGVLVIGERLALDGLLGIGEGDADGPVGRGRRRQNGELERVVSRAQIARRHARDVRDGGLLHLHAIVGEPFGRGQRGAQGARDLFLGKALKLKDAAAGDDRGGHGRVRVLRRRADQDERPLFDGGQERIGLRLVEAVTLVQQQIGAFSVQFQGIARIFHRLFDVCDAALHGVQLDKIPARRLGDDVGERRLAAAGRPPEDTASQPVQADGAPQEAALRDDVLLPDKFIQALRPHFFRERLGAVLVLIPIEQVHPVLLVSAADSRPIRRSVRGSSARIPCPAHSPRPWRSPTF